MAGGLGKPPMTIGRLRANTWPTESSISRLINSAEIAANGHRRGDELRQVSMLWPLRRSSRVDHLEIEDERRRDDDDAGFRPQQKIVKAPGDAAAHR